MESGAPVIDLTSNVSGFFRERLDVAMERHGVHTGELTQVYLLNLLTEFAAQPAPGLGRPMVERMAEALDAQGHVERLRRFRELGDSALYACGFFADSLERRGISRSYVVTMGGRAYDAAGNLVSRPGGQEAAFGDVYHELATKFDTFAKVIDDVRETTSLRTPQDIIRLYERWKKTRSRIIAERLEAEGLYPQDGDEQVH